MNMILWGIFALIIAAVVAALHHHYKDVDGDSPIILAIEIFMAITFFLSCFFAWYGL